MKEFHFPTQKVLVTLQSLYTVYKMNSSLFSSSLFLYLTICSKKKPTDTFNILSGNFLSQISKFIRNIILFQLTQMTIWHCYKKQINCFLTSKSCFLSTSPDSMNYFSPFYKTLITVSSPLSILYPLPSPKALNSYVRLFYKTAHL